LTVLRRFCRWAMGEGLMSRNPANCITQATVVATAPRELTDEQRYVLKQRIEAEQSRMTAIFALAYWAGLRISEIANLRHANCQINQRAGVIIVIDGKGKKFRTLDLHNKARRALYDYLQEPVTCKNHDHRRKWLFRVSRTRKCISDSGKSRQSCAPSHAFANGRPMLGGNRKHRQDIRNLPLMFQARRIHVRKWMVA
jgi:site-specific recombinase XerD